MPYLTRLAVITCVALALHVVAFAAETSRPTDWAAWRGPKADGVADGANLPIEWTPTKNVRWSVSLPGWGTSSPVVRGDHVYITSEVATDDGKSLLTLCYDRQSGRELWRHDFGFGVNQRTHAKSNLAANTPAVTDDALYVAFGNADIARYTHAGALVWVSRYLPKFGDPKMAWGYNISPLLLDDAVLFPWDHHTGPCFLVGLNPQTGEIAWQQDRPIGTAHATPLRIKHHGQEDILVPGKIASLPSMPKRIRNCGSTAKGADRSTARSSPVPCTETAWCSANCGGRARSTPSGCLATGSRRNGSGSTISRAPWSHRCCITVDCSMC